jgi:hypothetical protein
MIHRYLLRFIHVLKEWAFHFPYDFREQEMVDVIEYVQKKCIAIDESIKNDLNSVLSFLSKEVFNLILNFFKEKNNFLINKKNLFFEA